MSNLNPKPQKPEPKSEQDFPLEKDRTIPSDTGSNNEKEKV